MFENWMVLLAAHSVGDFVLQTRSMVLHKRQWKVLTFHAGIHALLTYGLMQQWHLWQVPLAVFALHAAIDALKARWPASPKAFAIDQVAHALSLAFVAAFVQIYAGPFSGVGWSWMVGVGGLAATVWGIGYFVGEIAARMIAENDQLQEQLRSGLRDGGKRIGQLERALIFALILGGEPSGIGFLVAAKSILRFEEAKKLPVAEYVLIGTLWSFGLALVIAWCTRRLILDKVF